MIKSAQKKFKDPKRQHLEDRKQNIFKAKKLWNGYLKNFREELKVTQALINGRVEGGDRIRINERLPEDTVQGLYNLADSFQKRVEEGNQILQSQNKYSDEYNSFFAELEQKRMQRLDDGKNQKINAPEKKQASFEYKLVREAGIGPIGLFWESLKSFFHGDEGARRASLLKQFAIVDSSLSEAQYALTSARSSSEIDSVRKKMYDLYRKVKSLKSIVAYGKDLNKKRMVEEFSESEENKSAYNNLEDDDKIKFIKEDLSDYDFFIIKGAASFDDSLKDEINKIYKKIRTNYFSLESQPKSQRLKESIIENYKNLLLKCFNGSFESFKDYKNYTGSKASSTYYEMMKFAESKPHDPIFLKFKKWLSSIGLDLNIFLPIRSGLIDASEVIDDCRGLLNQSINDLKTSEEINYDLCESSLKEISDLIEQSINNLDSISTFVNKESITDKTFEKINKSIESSTLKKLISFFGKSKGKDS